MRISVPRRPNRKACSTSITKTPWNISSADSAVCVKAATMKPMAARSSDARISHGWYSARAAQRARRIRRVGARAFGGGRLELRIAGRRFLARGS